MFSRSQNLAMSCITFDYYSENSKTRYVITRFRCKGMSTLHLAHCLSLFPLSPCARTPYSAYTVPLLHIFYKPSFYHPSIPTRVNTRM